MIHFYERCLKNAKETGDRSKEANVYGCLGHTYYKLGEFKTAISEYYERFLKVTGDVVDKSAECNVYSNLGNAYFSLGYSKEAIEWYERCLTVIAKAKSECREIKGSVYGNLGISYHELGFSKRLSFAMIAL